MEEKIKNRIKEIVKHGCSIPATDDGNGSSVPKLLGSDTLIDMIENGDFDDSIFVDIQKDMMAKIFDDLEINCDPYTEWRQIEFCNGKGDNPYHMIAWIW